MLWILGKQFAFWLMELFVSFGMLTTAVTKRRPDFSTVFEQWHAFHYYLENLLVQNNPILAFVAAILLFTINVLNFFTWHVVLFFNNRVGPFFGSPELKQGSNDRQLPEFQEISPPSSFMYKCLNPYQPLLPSVRLLTEFCKFRYFCCYPNEFTGFRSFCILHGKDRELQFVLEMVHIIDYVCQGFMNANEFFDEQQMKLLMTFRELPRSILIVNGKFLSSVVLPGHQQGEVPPNWVAHATLCMWRKYVLPNSPRELACVKRGYVGAVPINPCSIDLRDRFMKLVDVTAVAYAGLEKLLSAYSIDEIKQEIQIKTHGTHVLKSPSMLQQWQAIRRYELFIEQQRQVDVQT